MSGALYSLPPVGAPGGAGLVGAQNFQALYGPNLDELRATADAIKQVIGPNYNSFDRYIQSQQLGTFTAGNLGVVYEPVQPALEFVHAQIEPGLKDIISLFSLVRLDPTKQVIQKRFMIFNSSHWSRITDLMTGNQDMSTLFTSNANVIQFGKSAEMEVKAFRSANGATLWYNILKQAATGYVNTVIHTCISALLDCAPSRLSRLGQPSMLPYAQPVEFEDALEMASDIFGILGKGTNSLFTLFDYARQEAMRRGITGFNSLICDKGTVNRIQQSMMGIGQNIFDSWRNVPTESDATMYMLKHSEIRRLLEVGPVAVGPNSAKVLPFVRRVHVITHCIVDEEELKKNEYKFRTFDRFSDQFVDLELPPNAAVVDSRERGDEFASLSMAAGDQEARRSEMSLRPPAEENSGAEEKKIEASLAKVKGGKDEYVYVVFTALLVEVESLVFLASGVENGPELHLSPIIDAVAFHASQMKITYNAAFSAAAHIPNKNTIWFAEHAALNRVIRGPKPDSVIQPWGTALSVDHRCYLKISKSQLRGVHGNKFLSVTGEFPTTMTNQTSPILCFGGRTQDLNTVGLIEQASNLFPDAFDDDGSKFPIVSTLEYSKVGKGKEDPETQCDGWFGQHCYKGCMKALTHKGIRRPFNNDSEHVKIISTF